MGPFKGTIATSKAPTRLPGFGGYGTTMVKDSVAVPSPLVAVTVTG